jgi:hypothetical protein
MALYIVWRNLTPSNNRRKVFQISKAGTLNVYRYSAWINSEEAPFI